MRKRFRAWAMPLKFLCMFSLRLFSYIVTFIFMASLAMAGSSWNAYNDFWSKGASFPGATTPNTWSYGSAPVSQTNAVSAFAAFTENNLELEIPTGGPLFKHANPGAPEPCVARANAAWYPGAPPMPPFLFMHPSDNSYAIVRWQAPKSGSYKIDATFLASGEPGVKEVGVVQCKESGSDVVLLKPTLIAALNPTIDAQADYKGSIKLDAGESVAFYVGNGGDGYANDAVGLEAVITAQD